MDNKWKVIIAVICVVWICAPTTASYCINKNKIAGYTEQDANRLELVRAYADRVLDYGTDRWSGQNTPLLVDGINIDTGEPVLWRYDGDEFVISNLASQQNLFRVFAGLSNLTGDKKYKETAKESFQYHFDHLASDCGLLRWGGHQIIDLANLEPVGHFDANQHEFKFNFPFYELMWETDPDATARFIRAFWNAHILDWELLNMNRHGRWNLEMGELWESEFADPDPFFELQGLTFINAGGDLVYAAGMLYGFNQEQGALDWAQRLHGMYVKARHPDTGLGVYQYSKTARRAEPIMPMTHVRHTWGTYGDRAETMLGREFGDVAKEGWRMWGGTWKSIYVRDGFMKLAMAEAMGDAGAIFLDDTADGLRAAIEYGYVPEENHFLPLWADGSDLSGLRVPRYGYYCRETCDRDSLWVPYEADMEFVMTYARAYRLTGDPIFWETARQMARGNGLGDIGSRPGQNVAIDMNAPGSAYEEIFALLELYRAADHPDYLERARIVADRMIEEHYHNGFFFPSGNHVNANFNRIEPLALLTLDAVLRGEPELVPAHVGSRGYIHGRFEGMGRTNDSNAIWSVTRE